VFESPLCFLIKPQFSTVQPCESLVSGVAQGIILADVPYGLDATFREAADKRVLEYVVGIKVNTMLRPMKSELL
jgi:SRSO17 transposase